jgi:hypothetical protein
MRRSVCIVSPGNLAANPRILKEADALHGAGYAVTVVVSGLFDRPAQLRRDRRPRAVARECARRSRAAPSTPRPCGGKSNRGIGAAFPCRSPSAPTAARWRACAAAGVQADLYRALCRRAAGGGRSGAAHGAMLGFDAEDFHSGEGTDGPGGRCADGAYCRGRMAAAAGISPLRRR